MPPRLTVFPNDPGGSQENQSKDINLALTNINDWAKKISTSVPLNLKDDSAQSTTSTVSTTIPGYTQVFSVSGTLARIDLSLNITSPGVTTITVFIDGAPIRTVVDQINAKHLVYITDTFSTSSGQHTLEVQWKTSGGTLTKNADSGSALIVTNLI